MELGSVTATEIKKCGSAPGKQVVATVKGFTSQTAEVYNPAGIESNPPKGAKVLVFPLLGGKTKIILGGANYQIEPDVKQGGIKVYATDKDGKAVKASVLLKPDGSMELSAESGISIKGKKDVEVSADQAIKLSAGSKIAVKNKTGSLCKVLKDLAGHIKDMQTTPAVYGSPCSMGPGTIAQLEADIMGIAALLEE